jgi:UDP-N-acetyl-D-glucosamine dehydrogenase
MTSQSENDAHATALLTRLKAKTAQIGIIGLGYVGLPLCMAIARSGAPVTGFDIDTSKAEMLGRGKSYIKHISDADVQSLTGSGLFRATADFSKLADMDAILICVPTPLTPHLDPDLRYVVETTKTIAKTLRWGQLIILESTTYPGTTVEVCRPILEATGLKSSTDFFLAFSPEREDPGNINFSTSQIPKVVGGDGKTALGLADALYSGFVVKTVLVSSAATAEAVKITENVFRAVNIALVNELKVIYSAMGIDVWEVIDAAKTKPFGFMPFYPGPGLGGHCIPIDPFYLTWKAKEYGISTRFIELAGQINTAMPAHVVSELAKALDATTRKGLNGSKILVLGVAYKKNIDDSRESPALHLMELLEARGAQTDYFDPFIPIIPETREHKTLTGRACIAWTAEALKSYDVVLIATDHDAVDYADLVKQAPLIVDTRNVCARLGLRGAHIFAA